MRDNQLRLWFASFAYLLLAALRRIGLAHSRLAASTCGTIRLKVAMASACPYAQQFALAHARLCAAARALRLLMPTQTTTTQTQPHQPP